MFQTFEPPEFHRAGGKTAGRWRHSRSVLLIAYKAEELRKAHINAICLHVELCINPY